MTAGEELAVVMAVACAKGAIALAAQAEAAPSTKWRREKAALKDGAGIGVFIGFPLTQKYRPSRTSASPRKPKRRTYTPASEDHQYLTLIYNKTLRSG